MRDDFTSKVKDILAKRVNYKCSNPDCEKPTTGPNSDSNKFINIGVAAHITAASPGGPRYDDRLSSEERKSSNNGIWLCQSCAKVIDSDVVSYPISKLQKWKVESEEKALNSLFTENYRLRKEMDILLDAIEGRNNYGMLIPTGMIENDGRVLIQFYFGNRGKRPLYDVNLLIHDPEEIDEGNKVGMSAIDIMKLYHRIQIGNLPPQMHWPIFEVADFPPKGYFHYFAYIGTRNGVFHQEIFCYPPLVPKSGWETATRLTKSNLEGTGREVIHEYESENLKKAGVTFDWILDR